VDKVVMGERHMYTGEGLAFDPEGITGIGAFIIVFSSTLKIIFE